jgi:hypothetical protein
MTPIQTLQDRSLSGLFEDFIRVTVRIERHHADEAMITHWSISQLGGTKQLSVVT